MKEESRDSTVGCSVLPQDLIYLILTWVTLETLHSCRRVCTGWRRISYESDFIALHCRRTQTFSGYFVQGTKGFKHSSIFVSFTPLPPSVQTPSIEYLPEGTRILSSTHRGILLCKTPYNYKYSSPCYIVCQPANKQWREIPNPRTSFVEKVAIVASKTGILHFKIVRYSSSTTGNYMICEIFDSQTWRWRRHKDLPTSIQSPYHAVEIDSVVHWLVGPEDSTILAFDIKRENWWLIPLPQWPKGEVWRYPKLVGCEGKLCLIRVKNQDLVGIDELEVWAMTNLYSEGRWQRIFQRTRLQTTGSVSDLYTRQVAFATSIGENIWIDLQSGVLTKVRVEHLHPREVFKFESELSPCSL